LSFFDDGEETDPSPSAGAPSTPAGAERPPSASLRRPRPRRPGGAGHPVDQHTVIVRRRVAVGVGVVLLIVIILVINGCLKSEKQQALKDYNRSVSALAREGDEKVARPLFTTLSGAGGKSALNAEVQLDQLRIQAQNLLSRAKALNVPSEMSGAQRYLLSVLGLRLEALSKAAALAPTVLGARGKQASGRLAGDMEILLASDVLYSQRVAPLIQQELSNAGVSAVSTAPSRFLPNIGWLEPNTAYSRVSGSRSAASSGAFTPGNHGSALKGVSVGSTTLEPEPTLNHITGGGSPTFTLQVENSGEFPETNVKADVTVTVAGKQYKAAHVIEKTEPGKTVSVDIPVTGLPLGAAAKVEAFIETVQGENDAENNKGTFLAIFGR